MGKQLSRQQQEDLWKGMDAQGYWNENDKAIDELVGK